MPTQWTYQIRGRLRPRLEPGLARDLEGLLRNAEGATNALVLPRTNHPVPRHLPYAFAQGIPRGVEIEGPGFGPRLAYDGSRFDGLTGAEIRDGELRLGILAEGLEREADLGLEGHRGGDGPSRLEAILDLLTLVLAGPRGEVVGRILNQRHGFGHPVMRCADDRIRIVHVSAVRRNGGVANTLPAEIPAWCAVPYDDFVGDLDEDALGRWFASLEI